MAAAEPIRPLLVATLGGMAGWTSLALALWSFNHPHDVTPAPASTDLGPEPPAVAGLLANGFRVTTEAVPATLVDLAARGFLEIMLIAGGNHLVRVPGGVPDERTPYEDQVLAHVRRIAVQGVVPAEALSTGPRQQSRRWWLVFREHVIADAQHRGLCVNRWSLRAIGSLWLVAVLLGFLFALGVRFDSHVIGFDLSGAVLAAFVPLAYALMRITVSRSQRDTPRGLVVAARWLGVRAGLARNESLALLPPSAVAIWERHLAYAAALGLASRTCEQLPLGAEDDRLAWSSFGGRWRRVRVSYPRWPWWGGAPGAVAAIGVAVAVPAWWLLAEIRPPLMRMIHGHSSFAAGLRWIVVAFAAIAATAAVGASVAALHALTDLAMPPRVIEGAAVRLRAFNKIATRKNEPSYRYFVAVDDGRSDRVAAFSVRRDLYEGLSQGELVRVHSSARIGHVGAIERWTPRLSAGGSQGQVEQ